MKAHLAGFELKNKKIFPRRSKDKQNKAQKNWENKYFLHYFRNLTYLESK